MELKDEYFLQFIKNMMLKSIDRINPINKIEFFFESKKILYAGLFLTFLIKNKSLKYLKIDNFDLKSDFIKSYPGNIFNFNVEIYETNEINEFISQLIKHYQDDKSTNFSNISSFSLFINKIHQELMDYKIAPEDTNIKLINISDSKRKTGSIYTPYEIVSYMVNKILEEYLKKKDFEKMSDEEVLNLIKNLKILDPCMGTGIFLIEILNQLTDIVFSSLNNQNRHDKNEISKIILKNCLYGMELDFFSTEIARFLLLIYIDDINSIKNYLKDNFIEANMLIDDAFSDKNVAFSIIIGNPPYIRSDTLAKLQPELFNMYKNKFASVLTARQKSDIYFFFIKKSIELLNDEGLITFIIPNRFLINVYAKELRKFMLTHLKFIEIIDFNNFKDLNTQRVFKKIEVFPSIFLAQKSQQNAEIIVKRPNNFIELINSQYVKISQAFYKKMDYLIVIPEKMEHVSLLYKLFNKEKYMKLGELLSIGEGLRGITISKKAYQNIDLKEKELYVKEIRGKNIRKFYLNDFNGYYKLKKDLSYYREALRQMNKNHSFNSKITNEVEQLFEKIVVSEMGSELRAVLTNTGEFAYGGTYFITRFRTKLDLPLLLGILNSSIIKFLFNLIYISGKWGTSFKFRAYYLEQLPFPRINEEKSKFIEKIKILVHQILTKIEKVQTSYSFINNNLKEYLEKELENLDELVFSFYDLPIALLREMELK
ncbi:MAG: HsdM family class I SAM-dependent methyltransferase [Candidatus Helarchaeota archaeon]